MSNRISWDSYFMGIAKLVRERSEDPCCKVGACIVKDNKIISTGYNGMPSRSEHGIYPWTKGDTDPTKNKYFYVVHAELNAILNSIQDLHGCTLYVSLFPCNECAKAIIQAGISCVVYESDKYDGTEGNIASKRMFHEAGVKLVQLPYEIDVETKISER